MSDPTNDGMLRYFQQYYSAFPGLSLGDYLAMWAAEVGQENRASTQYEFYSARVPVSGRDTVGDAANRFFSGGTVVASGGVVTDIFVDRVWYKLHTFTTSGNFTVSQGGEVEYLVVAGGGGGGLIGGGGGAGGLKTGSVFASASSHAITVGAGGAGKLNVPVYTLPGGNGTNSSFGSLVVSTGGGGGGSGGGFAGNGGSGGGSGQNINTGKGFGIAGQGFDGGRSFVGARPCAGGGGAGGVGEDAENLGTGKGGDGGPGLSSSITGTAVFYAGGGGGGRRVTVGINGVGGIGGGGDGAFVGVPGTDGLGGGGGGGADALAGYQGGDGGDGVVIIRYRA